MVRVRFNDPERASLAESRADQFTGGTAELQLDLGLGPGAAAGPGAGAGNRAKAEDLTGLGLIRMSERQLSAYAETVRERPHAPSAAVAAAAHIADEQDRRTAEYRWRLDHPLGEFDAAADWAMARIDDGPARDEAARIIARLRSRLVEIGAQAHADYQRRLADAADGGQLKTAYYGPRGGVGIQNDEAHPQRAYSAVVAAVDEALSRSSGGRQAVRAAVEEAAGIDGELVSWSKPRVTHVMAWHALGTVDSAQETAYATMVDRNGDQDYALRNQRLRGLLQTRPEADDVPVAAPSQAAPEVSVWAEPASVTTTSAGAVGDPLAGSVRRYQGWFSTVDNPPRVQAAVTSWNGASPDRRRMLRERGVRAPEGYVWASTDLLVPAVALAATEVPEHLPAAADVAEQADPHLSLPASTNPSGGAARNGAVAGQAPGDGCTNPGDQGDVPDAVTGGTTSGHVDPGHGDPGHSDEVGSARQAVAGGQGMGEGRVALPPDASPVDGVDGYHYSRVDGQVTVYGPDNAPVACADYPGDGTVGGAVIPSRWGNFPKLAARQHRAAHLPVDQQDRVRIRVVPDAGAKAGYVVEVTGTDQDDPRDVRATKAVGHFLWSGRKQARVSGRNWTLRTVQENYARMLTAFGEQGRHIVVDGPSSATGTATGPSTAARDKGGPEPTQPDPRAMTDDELLQAITTAGEGTGYGLRRNEAAAARAAVLAAERQDRVLHRVTSAPDVTSLADQDLSAERQWLDEAFARSAFPFHGDGATAVRDRRDTITSEQLARRARVLLAGAVPEELDDPGLDAALSAVDELWHKGSSRQEWYQAIDQLRKTLQEGQADRRIRHYQQRGDVEGITLEDLVAESGELARPNEKGRLERREDVSQVRSQRLQAVDTEIERRESARFPNELARATISDRGWRRDVHIDGMPDQYAEVESLPNGHVKAMVGFSTDLGMFASRPAAVAAVVHHYDQDPATAAQRTWGMPRQVALPVGAQTEIWDWLRHRSGADAPAPLRRLAEILQHIPERQTQWNLVVRRSIQVYRYKIEEGLLSELSRVGDRVTVLARERSVDPDLDKADREAAKRRIPTMGLALHEINTVRDQAGAEGRDTDRKAVDDNQVVAQVAALAAGIADSAQDGGSGGDGRDDQQVHPDRPGPLAAAPSPGAGEHAGPGGVPAGHGPAAADGDDRGPGGVGGDAAAGAGLPGQGGPAQPDPSHGRAAGHGPAPAGTGGRAGVAGPGRAGADGGGPAADGPAGAVARFRPDPGEVARGPLARARANLEAVQVLRRLEQTRQAPSDDDRRTLARWSGWGSVPVVFLDRPDPKHPAYARDGERADRYEADLARWERYSPVRTPLRDLLDPFEWNAATRATLSAYYTPAGLAQVMWEGLAAFGFDGGEVLEAGCGSGVFFGAAPDLPDLRLTGVELDPVTARITSLIYPDVNVLTESFADTDAPAGAFDAAIGNVPFAQTPFTERRYGAAGHSLHNGFLIKQLALVREGGLVLAVTSRWTLDGEEATAARRQMAHFGDLLAAYRLPAGVFTETAGTDVVVDVLVLRRREQGQAPTDPVWLDAPARDINGSTHTVNAHFAAHPEHVLGHLTTEPGPYGTRPTVTGDPATALDSLREHLQRLAAHATATGQGYRPHPEGAARAALNLRTARDKHASDYTGRLYRDEDGRIWQHINGADPAPVVCSDARTDQLLALMRLRDVAAELKELDRAGDQPARAADLRARLRDLHTAYTTAYGPLSRPRQSRLAASEQARDRARAEARPVREDERGLTAWGWFREDPDAGTVLALESWDRAREVPVPSEVLTHRPGTRGNGLDRTDDPKVALTAVMGATGRVDLDAIADLLGTDPQQARRRLGTEVFDDPATGQLEHAGSYLSGAVRAKLDQARQAAASDPTYAVNVAALELVQPAPKRIGQFTPQLGAHWVPAGVVQGFLRGYLADPTLQVDHDDRYGWSVYAGKVPDAVNAVKGTDRRSALQIARAVLGRGSLTVEDTTPSGTTVIHEVNEDASRAARQKADAMRSAFEEYVTADSARVKALTDAYNRIMNGHVVRSYDGLSPSLAGFTTGRTPHAWQLSGAARMQFERAVILAHDVGLGKTTTMIMGAAALKASGQVTKPFVVMQRHLARAWLDEARLVYPAADIRLITAEMLAGDQRRRTLEWLRSNTPDLTLFTEGAFASIKMSPEYQEWYEFRELGNLRQQILRERGAPDGALAVRRLEQRLATVEARLRRNAAPMRTPGALYWEDLGFDYALIDEAHRFLGVGFRAKEAGGDTAKIRAVDLHQKLTHLHQVAGEHGGRPTVTLASGTPLRNSIFDQYKVLALAAPWVLEAFGVGGPDLWAQTFGQTVQRVEMAPDGSGLKVVERFSRFISKSAMKTMWGLVADTKTADEVGIARPRVAGAGPQLHLVDPTPDQKARFLRLVARGAAIHAGDVTRDEDNMLAVANEGRAIACDPRLVDPAAPPGPKLDAVADWFAARHHATKDRAYAVSHIDPTPHPTPGGLLIGFLNQGTPGGHNKGGFDAYATLRDLCVDRGIPREKIAFAQNHNRDLESLAELYRRCREGEVSLVLASTEVMGTGANVQNRAVALAHIDLDWTPAGIEQRNGRIERFGNQNPEVDIAIFGLRGSMDSWQVGLLAAKAEGLRDIQRPDRGDDTGDTVEEIGDTDWDYATMQAEIGGNPYMGQLIHARIHLAGLESDRRNHAADRLRQSELLARKQQEAELTSQAIDRREQVLPLITPVRGDDFTITLGQTTLHTHRQAAPPLRAAVADLLMQHRAVGRSPWRVLGHHGGLPFGARTELTETGQLQALVGFPDLRHSEATYTVDDLTKQTAGTAMLRHLATALEQAGNHQELDRQRLPALHDEIALLTQQQAAVDYTTRIAHARDRVNLLDDVVAAIAERDKVSELREEDLDPATYPTEQSRRSELARRCAERQPLQDKVNQAIAHLDTFDRERPKPASPAQPAAQAAPAASPTSATPSVVPAPSHPAQTPARGAAEPDQDATNPTAQGEPPRTPDPSTATAPTAATTSPGDLVQAPAAPLPAIPAAGPEPDHGGQAVPELVTPRAASQFIAEQVGQPALEPAIRTLLARRMTTAVAGSPADADHELSQRPDGDRILNLVALARCGQLRRSDWNPGAARTALQRYVDGDPGLPANALGASVSIEVDDRAAPIRVGRAGMPQKTVTGTVTQVSRVQGRPGQVYIRVRDDQGGDHFQVYPADMRLRVLVPGANTSGPLAGPVEQAMAALTAADQIPVAQRMYAAAQLARIAGGTLDAHQARALVRDAHLAVLRHPVGRDDPTPALSALDTAVDARTAAAPAGPSPTGAPPGDGEPRRDDDQPAVMSRFLPADRARIRAAAEDHATDYISQTLHDDAAATAATYVAQGHLRDLVTSRGLATVQAAVVEHLTARPEILGRPLTVAEKNHRAAARARWADTQARQALQAIRGDYAGTDVPEIPTAYISAAGDAVPQTPWPDIFTPREWALVGIAVADWAGQYRAGDGREPVSRCVIGHLGELRDHHSDQRLQAAVDSHLLADPEALEHTRTHEAIDERVARRAAAGQQLLLASAAASRAEDHDRALELLYHAEQLNPADGESLDQSRHLVRQTADRAAGTLTPGLAHPDPPGAHPHPATSPSPASSPACGGPAREDEPMAGTPQAGQPAAGPEPTPPPADLPPGPRGYDALNRLLAARKSLSDADRHSYDELATRVAGWTRTTPEGRAIEIWLDSPQPPELVVAFLNRLAATRHGAVNDTREALRAMHRQIAAVQAVGHAWDPRTGTDQATESGVGADDARPADAGPARGLAQFTPAEQVVIAHAVQDWAPNYHGGPLNLDRDSAVRYTSEGYLSDLVQAYGYNTVHDGVAEYLAAHPDLLQHRTTQEERAARAGQRDARAQELLRAANDAARGPLHEPDPQARSQAAAQALELVGQAELASPQFRDYGRYRARIRELAEQPVSRGEPVPSNEPPGERPTPAVPPTPPDPGAASHSGGESPVPARTDRTAAGKDETPTQPPSPADGAASAAPEPPAPDTVVAPEIIGSSRPVEEEQLLLSPWQIRADTGTELQDQIEARTAEEAEQAERELLAQEHADLEAGAGPYAADPAYRVQLDHAADEVERVRLERQGADGFTPQLPSLPATDPPAAAGTNLEVLAEALQTVRDLVQGADQVLLIASGPDDAGFVLRDVVLIGGTSLSAADPDLLVDVSEAARPALTRVARNAAVGEDRHGNVTLRLGPPTPEPDPGAASGADTTTPVSTAPEPAQPTPADPVTPGPKPQPQPPTEAAASTATPTPTQGRSHVAEEVAMPTTSPAVVDQAVDDELTTTGQPHSGQPAPETRTASTPEASTTGAAVTESAGDDQDGPQADPGEQPGASAAGEARARIERSYAAADAGLREVQREIAAAREALDQALDARPRPRNGAELSVGEAALQLLDATVAAAGRRLAPVADTPEWRQIAQVWKVTRQAWGQVRQLVERNGFRQAAEHLLRTLATRAAEAIAGLAERAVSRLGTATGLSGPARHALTHLATTARDVAAKVRALTPAAVDLQATNTRVQTEFRQTQTAVDAAFAEILAGFSGTPTRRPEPGRRPEPDPATPAPTPAVGPQRPAGETRAAEPNGEPTTAMRRWAGLVEKIDPALLDEPGYRRLAAAMDRAQSATEGSADVASLLPRLAARGDWAAGQGTTALRIWLTKECPAAATPRPTAAMAAVGARTTGSRPPERPPVSAPPRPAPRRGR